MGGRRSPWRDERGPSHAKRDAIYLKSVCGVVDSTIGGRGATTPTKIRTPGPPTGIGSKRASGAAARVRRASGGGHG